MSNATFYPEYYWTPWPLIIVWSGLKVWSSSIGSFSLRIWAICHKRGPEHLMRHYLVNFAFHWIVCLRFLLRPLYRLPSFSNLLLFYSIFSSLVVTSGAYLLKAQIAPEAPSPHPTLSFPLFWRVFCSLWSIPRQFFMLLQLPHCSRSRCVFRFPNMVCASLVFALPIWPQMQNLHPCCYSPFHQCMVLPVSSIQTEFYLRDPREIELSRCYCCNSVVL